jgi:hypothetical protein
VCAVVAARLVLPVAAEAFTATRAARNVISQMRVAARKLVALQVERSGDLVYCPQVPEGWTSAPRPGCRARAHVPRRTTCRTVTSERILGHVTAAHLPELTYVV